MADEPVIEYGVKELIGNLRTEVASGFSRVEALMGSKADKADLAEIRGELHTHAARLVDLEKHRDDSSVEARVRRMASDRRDAWFKFAIPTGLTAVYTVLFLIQAHVF